MFLILYFVIYILYGIFTWKKTFVYFSSIIYAFTSFILYNWPGRKEETDIWCKFIYFFDWSGTPARWINCANTARRGKNPTAHAVFHAWSLQTLLAASSPWSPCPSPPQSLVLIPTVRSYSSLEQRGYRVTHEHSSQFSTFYCSYCRKPFLKCDAGVCIHILVHMLYMDVLYALTLGLTERQVLGVQVRPKVRLNS